MFLEFILYYIRNIDKNYKIVYESVSSKRNLKVGRPLRWMDLPVLSIDEVSTTVSEDFIFSAQFRFP